MYPLAKINVPNIEQFNMGIHAKKDIFISEHLRINGIWEPFETLVTTKLIKPGDIVYDIGANIGYNSIITSKLVKESGKVVAFEPEPTNFKLLKFNLSKNNCSNVVCESLAASDEVGATHLYLNEDNLGDHRMFKTSLRRKRIRIQQIDIDSYPPASTEKIDFVKIDVQGAEHRVVSGMEHVISNNRDIIKVALEFWPNALDMAGNSADHLISLMAKLFSKFLVIDEPNETLFEVTLDQLAIMSRGSLRKKEDSQINILCFGSPRSFAAFLAKSP